MNTEQKKEVGAFAKEQFAFLKAEKGFTRQLINQPANGLLIYRDTTIGIGVKLHFSFPGYPYDYMEIMIGKLRSDGNFPKFPYTGEGHIRSFWLLQSFLIRQLHIEDNHIQAIDQRCQDFRVKGDMWNIDQWQEIINLYKVLLYDHIDLILLQPSEVLFPTAIEYLLVGLTEKELVQFISNHFAFLQDYGFQPDPVVEHYGAQYTWISADRGIQLSRDYQSGDISCWIVKLIDGKLPTFEKRDLKRDEFIRGRRVVVSLGDLLHHRLGLADAEIDAIRNIYAILTLRDMSDYDYTYSCTIIRLYATLIRRYITQLMQTSL